MSARILDALNGRLVLTPLGRAWPFCLQVLLHQLDHGVLLGTKKRHVHS